MPGASCVSFCRVPHTSRTLRCVGFDAAEMRLFDNAVVAIRLVCYLLRFLPSTITFRKIRLIRVW
jgi:hypothetical protein